MSTEQKLALEWLAVRQTVLDAVKWLEDEAARASDGPDGDEGDVPKDLRRIAARLRRYATDSDAALATAPAGDAKGTAATYCDADCTTGPEGGALHSVACQFRRAGGRIRTCPVCGEERHEGTCIDAAQKQAGDAKGTK